MNSVILCGTLSGVPVHRSLASGSTLVSFAVTTPTPTGKVSVPVSWFDPPASARPLEEGDEVVVCGIVQRRFYRAGGLTQSRTDVMAQQVVPARRRGQVQKVLQDWLDRAEAGVANGDQPLPSSAKDNLSRSTKVTSPARSQTRGS